MNGHVARWRKVASRGVEIDMQDPVASVPDGTRFMVYRVDRVTQLETIVAVGVASQMKAPAKRMKNPLTLNLAPAPGWDFTQIKIGDLVRLATAPTGRLDPHSPHP